MSWTPLAQYLSNAQLRVFKDGNFIDPIDYTAESVTLSWNGDAVLFTYPENTGAEFIVDVSDVYGSTISLPARFTSISHTPEEINANLIFRDDFDILVTDSVLDPFATQQQFENVSEAQGFKVVGLSITTAEPV